MTEEEALLAAVVAAPDDDTPRLAYADWLDDHADQIPGRDPVEMRNRAEYIRVTIELAKQGCGVEPKTQKQVKLFNRWQELAGDQWRDEARKNIGVDCDINFHRGFADSLYFRFNSHEAIKANFTAEPIASLHVRDLSDDQIHALADVIRHTSITDLSIDSNLMTDRGINSLAILAKLKSLRINSHRVTDQGLVSIATLTNITDLNLGISAPGITNAGIAYLPNMTSLKMLCLPNANINNNCLINLSSIANLENIHFSTDQQNITREAVASSNLALSAKHFALGSLGVKTQEEGDEILRRADPNSQPPPIEWFQTNWSGHPGEVLYRTPLSGLGDDRISEIQTQVIAVLCQTGLSHDVAKARVVVRNSVELGQPCLTVAGNAACIALTQAIGRGQLAGNVVEEKWIARSRKAPGLTLHDPTTHDK